MEGLIASARDFSRSLRVTYVTYLLLALYTSIIIGATTDVQLLLDGVVAVPFLSNISLPISWFYSVVPWVFLVIHVEILLHFRLLADKLNEFNVGVSEMKAKDVRRLRRQLSDSIFIYWVAGGGDDELMKKVSGIAIWVTLAFLPLTLLLAIQVGFLPFHSHIITWQHRVVIVLDVLALGALWPKLSPRKSSWPNFHIPAIPSESLADNALLPRRFFNAVLNVVRRHFSLAVLYVFLAIVLMASFYIIVIPGYPQNTSSIITGWLFERDGAWLHRSLDLTGYVPENSSNELGKLTVAPHHAFEQPPLRRVVDGVIGMNLTGRDLQYAVWPNAFLVNADLRGANLDGATLLSGRLQSADLRGASLRGATLVYAHLENATLKGAVLRGASLEEAEFMGANLEDADLAGAMLSFLPCAAANCWGDSGAHFEGALIVGANLAGTFGPQAHFEGSDLSLADMSGANLFGAAFQGADLGAAEFVGASLDWSRFEGARMRAANVTSATMANSWWQGNDLRDLRGWRESDVLSVDVAHDIANRVYDNLGRDFVKEYVDNVRDGQINDYPRLYGLLDRVGLPVDGFSPTKCLSHDDDRCHKKIDANDYEIAFSNALSSLVCDEHGAGIGEAYRPYVVRSIVNRMVDQSIGDGGVVNWGYFGEQTDESQEKERRMWQGLSVPFSDPKCSGGKLIENEIMEKLIWLRKWNPELPQRGPSEVESDKQK